MTYVVEFERVWWDKYAKHPSDQGVSFWRPKAPPGYVALGDVVSAGHYAPPCEVSQQGHVRHLAFMADGFRVQRQRRVSGEHASQDCASC